MTTAQVQDTTTASLQIAKDGYAAFLNGESETFLDSHPEEFVAQNDRVVDMGHSTSLVMATGRKYETDGVHVFTMTDVKVSRLVEFFDNAKAERAYRTLE